jgi:hypothetical protein
MIKLRSDLLLNSEGGGLQSSFLLYRLPVADFVLMSGGGGVYHLPPPIYSPLDAAINICVYKNRKNE